MVHIKHSEMRIIEDAFISGGYVLNFSNKTFSEFFEDEFGLSIYDEKYAFEGTSKGNHLRAFVKTEEPALVSRVLRALWLHYESTSTREQLAKSEKEKERLFALLSRLEAIAPVFQPGIDNRGANIGQVVMVQGSATFGPTTITMPSSSPAPSSGAPPTVTTAKPAVILLCTANAVHPNHRMRLEEELRAIDDALQRARRRDLYPPRMCPAVTFSKVIHELDDHEPAFLHFSGHGDPSGDLILKGERSEELLVPPARIAELLEAVPKRPTLVTFATSHSRALAEAAARHAGFAIGFDGGLDDDSAPLFSAMLYERLASREEVDVERAFKLATIACKAEGHVTVELARLFAYPGLVVR